MGKILPVAAYIVFLTTVSALGTEMLLGIYHYLDAGEALWTRDSTQTPPASGESRSLRPQTRQTLSPYLGYSLRPGWRLSANANLEQHKRVMGYTYKPGYWDWKANNLGFFDNHDYPYIPADRDRVFIVGITGGSVANGLAVESRTELTQIIKSVAALVNKEVAVLNISGGGYKQPQQLLALGYLIALGQPFDLIINFDGFNEAYMGWENVRNHHAHVTALAAQFVYGLQNQLLSAYSRSAENIFAVRAEKERLQKRMERTRSAFVYYVTKIRADRLLVEEVDLESEIGSKKPDVDYPLVLLPASTTDTDRMAEEIAGVWFRSSVAMKALADSVGAAYIHMIQPNQYFTDRVFSEPERKLAFRVPPHAGATIVPPTYRRMLEAAKKFPAYGVTFIDATRAFDAHREPLYFDPCCHFNKRGYDILVKDYLSDAIKRIQTWNK